MLFKNYLAKFPCVLSHKFFYFRTPEASHVFAHSLTCLYSCVSIVLYRNSDPIEYVMIWNNITSAFEILVVLITICWKCFSKDILWNCLLYIHVRFFIFGPWRTATYLCIHWLACIPALTDQSHGTWLHSGVPASTWGDGGRYLWVVWVLEERCAWLHVLASAGLLLCICLTALSWWHRVIREQEWRLHFLFQVMQTIRHFCLACILVLALYSQRKAILNSTDCKAAVRKRNDWVYRQLIKPHDCQSHGTWLHSRAPASTWGHRFPYVWQWTRLLHYDAENSMASMRQRKKDSTKMR